MPEFSMNPGDYFGISKESWWVIGQFDLKEIAFENQYILSDLLNKPLKALI